MELQGVTSQKSVLLFYKLFVFLSITYIAILLILLRGTAVFEIYFRLNGITSEKTILKAGFKGCYLGASTKHKYNPQI
jgi:hypothetical protein